MTVISALVRVQKEESPATWQALVQLPGVIPFALDEPSRLGVVVEADSLEDAYQLLNEEIRATPGVLRVVPAYAHFDNDPRHQ